MESYSWPENLPSNRNKAIQELTNAHSHTITLRLREVIGRLEKTESDLKSADDVVVQMLGIMNNARSFLQSSNPNKAPHNPTHDVIPPNNWVDQKREGFDKSIKTKAPVKTKRGCFNRRKFDSTITTFTSTLVDDGHAWRKYGQKVILNSKHQRHYYRCSHKLEQGCQAIKHVQMIDDEPSKYMITYYGSHTCNNLQRSQIFLEAPSPKDNSKLISFETNTLIETNKVDTLYKGDGFSSPSHLQHEQVSSFYHNTPWDSIVGLTQIPSGPMSMMSGLYCEDEISSGVCLPTCSTYGYEIDCFIQSHDCSDLLF